MRNLREKSEARRQRRLSQRQSRKKIGPYDGSNSDTAKALLMITAILEFARRVKSTLRLMPGVVLEVGNLNVNGTIREVFEEGSESYTAIDLTPGSVVNKNLDAHRLNEYFASEKFDTLICCECLEHDAKPWITVSHLHNLLKPGGYLFVTTPTFGFPLHRYPIDCYRYGEDAYREFIFEGMDILFLEEVHNELGQPVICCLGRKHIDTPLHEPRVWSDLKYRIPDNPQLGLVVGTYGTPGYIALHLHILKMHDPEVPVLIVDDCSPEYEMLNHWCQKYGSRLFVNPVRLGHARGDMAVFVQGLIWAKQMGLDMLVKFSRRFLPICPWVDEIKQLAVSTQHHTYSNVCNSHGLGFQTQAVGMHVERHYKMLPEYVRGVEGDPGLVEAFVHQQIAQKLPLDQTSLPYDSTYKGYAAWPLVGSRHERNYPAFWHEVHSKYEYYCLARLLGIEAGIEQF